MSRLSVVSADKVNSTTEQLMKEFTQRIVANPPGVCPVDMQLGILKSMSCTDMWKMCSMSHRSWTVRGAS